MSVEAHRRVERLMAEAEVLEAAGRIDDARALYLQAAKDEAFAFDRVPPDRPRTRGILAVGTASLYWRARAYKDVIRYAGRYLSDAELPAFARHKLGRLIVDAEEALQSARSGCETGVGSDGLESS